MKIPSAKSRFAIVAVALFAFVPPAYSEELLFQDDFKSNDKGWDFSVTPKATIKDGLMTVETDVDRGDNLLNLTHKFQDAAVSAKIKFVSGDQNSSAGILFWAKDYGDYYIALINANGELAIYHWVNQKRDYTLSWTSYPQINKGIGSENVLKIVTHGTEAKININGKDVTSLNGQPPPGGGRVGLRGSSPKAKGSVSTFSEFKVTK